MAQDLPPAWERYYMTGWIESVDFTLLNGAGLNCTRATARCHSFDERFADWVMVRRSERKRDEMDFFL
jgi:hypothetical protein